MKAKIGWLSICMAGGIFFSLFQASADRKMAPGRVATETVQTVNTPEQIRSLISRMKEQMEKDAETLPELMKETEQQAETCTDPAGAAVLHSMLAELYNHYYQQNRWKIGQRTELAGYVPDDIREWTPSLFEQKIKEELERSLQPAALLQQTKAETFQAILKEGKDSRRLRPTLFDFPRLSCPCNSARCCLVRTADCLPTHAAGAGSTLASGTGLRGVPFRPATDYCNGI